MSTAPIRVSFARACSGTRIALDLTQRQVADRVGVSRYYIAKVELGIIDPTLSMVERIAEALGLELDLGIQPPSFGGRSEVRGVVHARCSAYADRRVRAAGWSTAREVEIVHGRSHGWIDVLAFHPVTGTLLVIEIKTRLDDLGAVERQLSWYERAAWGAARSLGWHPRRLVACCLALASDEVERSVRAHRDLMRVGFPLGARELGQLIVDPGSDRPPGRAFALVDPSSRRRDWLIRTSIEGRRSRLPYTGYAHALARMTAGS